MKVPCNPKRLPSNLVEVRVGMYLYLVPRYESYHGGSGNELVAGAKIRTVQKHDIFSSGGVKKVTNSKNLPHLGSIPLTKDIMECADNGTPYVLNNPEGKELFSVIVKDIFKQLNAI